MRKKKAAKNKGTLRNTTEKIASIIEKRLAKFPDADRDAKLNEIHRIALTVNRLPSEKASGPQRTQESRLLARPREES